MTTRWINPADCVDMDCDARRKIILDNPDGTFFGQPKTSAISKSEFGWGGDRKWGLSNRRIPKTLLSTQAGGRLNADTVYPKKGIARGSGKCTFSNDWNMYKCVDMKYRMFVFESLDADTETRRLSPIALATNDGYIDLINGPQDHGWCHGYTCQERVSMFQMVVNVGQHYNLFLTSYNPQKTRLMLLNSEEEEAVRVAIYYPKPQRLDVYINDRYVRPTNAVARNGRLEFDPIDPAAPQKYIPNINGYSGGNWFNDKKKLLYIVTKGSDMVLIKTTPVIQLRLGVKSSAALNEDEFFGPKLAENIAAFFGIPKEKIFRVEIVSAGEGKRRRKRRAIEDFTIEIGIGDQPQQSLDNSTTPTANSTDNNEAANETLSANTTTTSFDDLANTYAKIVDDFQTGTFSQMLADDLNVTLDEFAASEPEPEPVDPTGGVRATNQTEQIVNGTITLAELQLLQAEASLNKTIKVYSIPSTAGLHQIPSKHNNEERSAFILQPSFRLYDASGKWVENVGGSGSPWEVSASLVINKGGDQAATLIGNTVAKFIDGTALFENLGISHNGTNYTVVFEVTKPANLSFKAQADNITALWVKEEKVADHVLDCQPSGMNITFNLHQILGENQPFEIRFLETNESHCGGINKSSTANLDGSGGMFIFSDYGECGISIMESGDYFIFNQTVQILYGEKINSSLVYRHYTHSTAVSCMFHQNQTSQMSFNVYNRITENIITKGIGEFKFDFGIFKNDDTPVTGLVTIGEELKFKLKLLTSATNVLLSPQNCYSERADGTGRVNVIENRCENQLFPSVKIASTPNDKKYFEWNDRAFRYYGTSNAIRFTCELLICPVVAFANRTEECMRCSQVSDRRRRRDVSTVIPSDQTSRVTIQSQPIILIEPSGSENNNVGQPQKQKQVEFVSSPAGVAVITMSVVFACVMLAVLVKVVFLKKKTVVHVE